MCKPGALYSPCHLIFMTGKSVSENENRPQAWIDIRSGFDDINLVS